MTVIKRFSAVVRAEDGLKYSVVLHGRRLPDGQWDGWLEFELKDRTRISLVSNMRERASSPETLVQRFELFSQDQLKNGLFDALEANRVRQLTAVSPDDTTRTKRTKI